MKVSPTLHRKCWKYQVPGAWHCLWWFMEINLPRVKFGCKILAEKQKDLQMFELLKIDRQCISGDLVGITVHMYDNSYVILHKVLTVFMIISKNVHRVVIFFVSSVLTFCVVWIFFFFQSIKCLVSSCTFNPLNK